MRRALLTSLLLLPPSLASAASQCTVQAPERNQDAQPLQQQPIPAQPSRLQPPRPTAPLSDLRAITADEISRVPALQRIASRGAQLTDLGTEHGLRSVFARSGQTFQVFYLTPDGQGAIGGVMWDAAGHNITRQTVSQIDGAIPTVTIGVASPPTSQATPETAPSPPLWSVATTTYGTTGAATAPRLWVFIDPLCSFSVRAIEQLRPFIAAGKVQVAVIPLSLLDYEDHGRSTVAAKVMLSKDKDHMVDAWTSNSLTGETDATSTATLQANMAVSEALALRGTPTFYWRKADGSEGRQEGLPNDIGDMIASIDPAGG
jgi:thiol:disulfide interchange protein DsbG